MPTQKKTSKRARPRSSRWRTCHSKYRMVSIAVARRAIVSIAPAPRGGAAAHQGSGGRESRGPGSLQTTLVPSLPPSPPLSRYICHTRSATGAAHTPALRSAAAAGAATEGRSRRRRRSAAARADRRSTSGATIEAARLGRLQGRCCRAGHGWRGRRGGGGIDSRTHVHSLAAAVCPPIPP